MSPCSGRQRRKTGAQIRSSSCLLTSHRLMASNRWHSGWVFLLHSRQASPRGVNNYGWDGPQWGWSLENCLPWTHLCRLICLPLQLFKLRVWPCVYFHNVYPSQFIHVMRFPSAWCLECCMSQQSFLLVCNHSLWESFSDCHNLSPHNNWKKFVHLILCMFPYYIPVMYYFKASVPDRVRYLVIECLMLCFVVA